MLQWHSLTLPDMPQWRQSLPDQLLLSCFLHELHAGFLHFYVTSWHDFMTRSLAEMISNIACPAWQILTPGLLPVCLAVACVTLGVSTRKKPTRWFWCCAIEQFMVSSTVLHNAQSWLETNLLLISGWCNIATYGLPNHKLPCTQSWIR